MMLALEKVNCTITTPSVDAAFGNNPAAWLVAKATEYHLSYLLAHADDGVMWGYLDATGLRLSGAVFPEVKVDLDARTLQQARFFGPRGELFVYRAEGGWSSRLIVDGAGDSTDTFVQKYWLWGTLGDLGREKDGFTLLVEGIQGLRHAPSVTNLDKTARVALAVRHYVDYDEKEGLAYVRHSRLENLHAVKGGVG
jgi:CRISPR-associated protein (TIGR03984 family)